MQPSSLNLALQLGLLPLQRMYGAYPDRVGVLKLPRHLTHALNPLAATLAENHLVSPAIATDPKTPLSKSFSCHTSETPLGAQILSRCQFPVVTPHWSRVHGSPSTFQISFLFILLRTPLLFFALAKNSTLFFSIDSALCDKNTGSGEGAMVNETSNHNYVKGEKRSGTDIRVCPRHFLRTCARRR